MGRLYQNRVIENGMLGEDVVRPYHQNKLWKGVFLETASSSERLLVLSILIKIL